jgi:amino-acid N-acetyltransferase
VPRAHLIPFSLDGSVLLELFLHDGVGTMLSDSDLESLREATLDDVGGILQLIAPLEADGTLVPRGRHLIERDIDKFSVIEHDGVLFGCAALYEFPRENMGEMACLTVSPEAQGTGDGERPAQAHRAPRPRAGPGTPVRAHHAYRALVPQARLRPRHGRRPARRQAQALQLAAQVDGADEEALTRQ